MLYNTKKVEKMKDEKRYTAIISVYVYAQNDEDAKKEARKIVEKIGDIEDNYAGIESLHETQFAMLKARKVEL